MTKAKNLLQPKFIVMLIAFLFFLILPTFIESNYIITVLIKCMAFAVFGMAWNIIGGYGAQVSWASASFVAIGAYTNFIMQVELSISPFLSIPVGMLLSFLFATLIGYGTFRLRGAYFAIATIAFAEAFRGVLQYFSGLTRGSAGMFITYRGNNFLALSFSNDRPFYFIFLVLVIISLIVSRLFIKSKTGYYLGCIKGDEDAAETLGIETFKVKLKAFQISAIMMSVAGAFYASFLTFISPISTASFNLSVMIGIVAIVGGTATLWGPVLGAFIIVPLIELSGVLLGAAGASNVLYGLLLVVMVMFRPSGLITILYALFDKIKKIRDGNRKVKVPISVDEEDS
ncbi:MAG: branched-chain amino acid ABC transporter permease [Lachnospiraceae bacterium]|nr:branched-chain amino acid ABC transporter permease [Lachnospiraceae bacterium]